MEQRFRWGTAAFLGAAHVLGAVAVVYMATVHFSWWTLGLGCLWALLCGLAITAGYHRLFAHRSYRAAWPVRLAYLAFGAAAVQNSALKWSADHRVHHSDTDGALDPYSIRRGFWWAHIGWVVHDGLRDEERDAQKLVADLTRDPLVRWQSRYYIPLAFFVGVAVPAAIGSLWGDALGAALVVGFLRLVFQWHTTFLINSWAHFVGRKPYAHDITARDSALLSLVTLGEGYHNFHHRFQSDYRNGVRWYDFDPTKWTVYLLSRLGLTWDLKRIPTEVIRDARTHSVGTTRSEAA